MASAGHKRSRTGTFEVDLTTIAAVIGFPGLHEGRKGMSPKFEACFDWFLGNAVRDPNGYEEMERMGIVADLIQLRDLNAQRLLEKGVLKQFYNETQKEFVANLIAKLREFLSMESDARIFAKFNLQRVLRGSEAKDARIAELEAQLLAASGAGCVPSPPKMVKPCPSVKSLEPAFPAVSVASDTTAATGATAVAETQAGVGDVGDVDLGDQVSRNGARLLELQAQQHRLFKELRALKEEEEEETATDWVDGEDPLCYLALPDGEQ